MGSRRKEFTPFGELKPVDRSDDLDEIVGRLSEYLAGARRHLEVDYDIESTETDEFTRRVLRETARVPYGRTRTYQQIARAVDSPNAARAVGTAVGHNPVSWLVPCHRVIRSGGMLGGYHWGEARKLAMLGWESAASDNQSQLRLSMAN